MKYVSYICKTRDFSSWCLAEIINIDGSTVEIRIDSTISPSIHILVGKSIKGPYMWIPDYEFGCSLPSFINLRSVVPKLLKVVGARNTAIILKGIQIIHEELEVF